MRGDAQKAIGKKWGEANGYVGGSGGHIYSVTNINRAEDNNRRLPRPVCQGWAYFARMMRRQILKSGRPVRGQTLQAGYDQLDAIQRSLS